MTNFTYLGPDNTLKNKISESATRLLSTHRFYANLQLFTSRIAFIFL
ncbi:hypothetical protein PHET_09647 [Paragonimus heterotremus]|uniref:Uncharacterized protein n=1 Tax=Paragonimus heterotremus TaxID=100268 RepID=A0A8J4WEK4_9TREM|nr:hypothetical protein PHET_09647 [Paragonimus heterotremus]